MAEATSLITASGLNPTDFCIIRNQCFLQSADTATGTGQDGSADSSLEAKAKPSNVPFWYIGQRFFQDTSKVAAELSDWFDDPTLLSDWLLDQQERMVFQQPLVHI